MSRQFDNTKQNWQNFPGSNGHPIPPGGPTVNRTNGKQPYSRQFKHDPMTGVRECRYGIDCKSPETCSFYHADNNKTISETQVSNSRVPNAECKDNFTWFVHQCVKEHVKDHQEKFVALTKDYVGKYEDPDGAIKLLREYLEVKDLKDAGIPVFVARAIMENVTAGFLLNEVKEPFGKSNTHASRNKSRDKNRSKSPQTLYKHGSVNAYDSRQGSRAVKDNSARKDVPKSSNENHWSRISYNASSGLKEADHRAFKSAGILVFRWNPELQTVEVLCAYEFKHQDGKKGLSFLGGQRDSGEHDSQQVACREFSEETARIIRKEEAQTLLNQPSTVPIWLHCGKYVLYGVTASSALRSKLHDLPTKYKKEKNYHHGAEAEKLMWVSFHELVKRAQGDNSADCPYLLNFLRKVLSDANVLDALHLLCDAVHNFEEDIQQDIARWKRLKRTNAVDLDKWVGKDWKLKLKAPETPPPPAVQQIDPRSSKYKTLVQQIPPEYAGRIVSIWSAKVSTREQEYQQARGNLKEEKPMYHGTPQVWRSIAIAYDGFDTKIKLHGRAMGDGVYTTNDIQLASTYASQSGSILSLKICSQQNERKDNRVVVIKDPKRVCTTHIYDFAQHDATCQDLHKQKGRHASYDERKANIERINVELETMCAERESSLKNEANRMVEQFLTSAERLQELYNALPSDTGNASDKANIQKQYFREKYQFESKLPIYAHKRDVIQAVRDKGVVIIMSPTGSGKSTQVPQYLLDHLDGSTADNKRIAVLEPRRVNVRALCNRVSEERFSTPGREVGYRLGRGDVEVSDATKLEFMTHGLFVQFASDVERLARNYSVVVIDEAHERSVEIDLSFSLLKHCIEKMKDKAPKIVVMSATIQSQVNLFREFLDPELVNSKVVELPGSCFPVLVQYRDELCQNIQEMNSLYGTGGSARVFSKYALQLALDILQSSDDGNILVFMTGETHLRMAMDACRQKVQPDQGSTTRKDEIIAEIRMKKKTKTIGIFPLYGRLSKAGQMRIFDFSKQHRSIVFCTNVAETGLTIPNVRYVIDTGHERVASWNSVHRMTQLATKQSTISSIEQRKGRAGRNGTGICIRLFPEETVEQMEKCPLPAVGSKDIVKAVLLLSSGVVPSNLPMLTPIDQETWTSACQILQKLGALDSDNAITVEGSNMLKMGLNLRLCRFLMACNRSGCLFTGSMLAAILTCDRRAEILRKVRTHKASEFIHETGDHMTLLQVFREYQNQHEKKAAVGWCDQYGFDPHTFEEIESTHVYIMDILKDLHYDLRDNPNTARKVAKGNIDKALLCCLCSGFGDQLCVPRSPGDANQGFDMLRSSKDSASLSHFVSEFQESFRSSFVNEQNKEAEETKTDEVDGEQTKMVETVKMSLTSKSVVHELKSLPENYALAIYDSVILTDGGNCVPNCEVLSYVSLDHVKKLADGTLCKHVESLLLNEFNRLTNVYPISTRTRGTLLQKNLDWLNRLRRRYRDIVVVVGDSQVKVTALSHSMPLYNEIIKKKLAEIATEIVTIHITDDDTAIRKLIGSKGKNIEALRTRIRDYIAASIGVPSRQVKEDNLCNVQLRPKDKPPIIELQFSGSLRMLAPVLIVMVQDEVARSMGTKLPRLFGDKSVLDACQNQQNLGALVSETFQPRNITDERSAHIAVAHALIHCANVTIYGGYVRDFVIRNERPNDIDCLIGDGDSHDTVQQKVLTRIQHLGFKMTRSEDSQFHPGVRKVDFQCNSWVVQVDLVQPRSLPFTHPGADADVNNLQINRKERLALKAKSPNLINVATSVDHCLKKEFVFYYDRNQGKHRLHKMLNKGWKECQDPCFKDKQW